MLNNCGNNQN